MKQAFLYLLVLSALVVGLIAWVRSVQQSDTSYVPRVTRPMWAGGGPAVAIDDAHWNTYTATRGYGPFSQLLRADNYTVIASGSAASPEVLTNAKVIVIANALGFRGVVRQVGQVARVNLDGLAADAFSDPEVEALDNWVKNGGSLLLAADPSPAGRAARSLAERFGVRMRDAMVFDPEHSEENDPTTVIFTREGKTLAPHPIAGPEGKAGSVERVVTFGGQALEGPVHATQLLMLSGTAYERKRPASNADDRVAVPGLAQALAMFHGRGKVVVLGDADVITSRVREVGAVNDRIGLQWRNSDNESFARRIVGWLSGAVE
jgi:hypothetical protein